MWLLPASLVAMLPHNKTPAQQHTHGSASSWKACDHDPFTQGYKDIYSSVTFKYTQEFVLVMFNSYSALTNRQNITNSHSITVIDKQS